MKALLVQILAFLKDSFEKVIFWSVLAVFLILSVKLGTQWGGKGAGMSVEAELGLEQRYNPSVLNKDIPKEETLGASAGLFTKKPILYYRDFYKRNVFSPVQELRIKKTIAVRQDPKLPAPPPAVKYEYVGVIDIGGRLVATIRNRSTGKGFYVEKGELVEKLKVLDITKTYVLLSDEVKKKNIKIEINK